MPCVKHLSFNTQILFLSVLKKTPDEQPMKQTLYLPVIHCVCVRLEGYGLNIVAAISTNPT